MSEENRPERDDTPQFPLLDPVEARILACLMEKQRTTPDAYPLTLNALVQACNQKTSRSPVMRLETGEVGHKVNQLRDRELIHASFTGRAERYDHKMASSYRLNRQEQALLCVLMLRGPQTEGELRTNAGRMAEFANLEEVQTILTGMAERKHPLVTGLPRLPGKREQRFGQLLCGEITQKEQPVAAHSHSQDLRGDRIAALEAQIASMREELDALWKLTGLSNQRAGEGGQG